MFVEGIGEVNFKHVAVKDVHNAAGDFICGNFDGPAFGESALNPTNNGIFFFRFNHPPYAEKVEYELRYLQALHEKVELDAIVVFGMAMGSTSESLAIAMGVNKIDPKIKILMQVLGQHFDTPLQEAIDTFVDNVKRMEKVVIQTRAAAELNASASDLPVCLVDMFYCREPRECLMHLLDLNPDYKTEYNQSDLFRIADTYKHSLPLLGNPKKLAENVPELPHMRSLAQFSRGILRGPQLKL